MNYILLKNIYINYESTKCSSAHFKKKGGIKYQRKKLQIKLFSLNFNILE